MQLMAILVPLTSGNIGVVFPIKEIYLPIFKFAMPGPWDVELETYITLLRGDDGRNCILVAMLSDIRPHISPGHTRTTVVSNGKTMIPGHP